MNYIELERAYNALRKSSGMDGHVLFSLAFFIARRTEGSVPIEPDQPLRTCFLGERADSELILALGEFELNHGISIPHELVNPDMTLSELTAVVAALPLLSPSEYNGHMDQLMRPFKLVREHHLPELIQEWLARSWSN